LAVVITGALSGGWVNAAPACGKFATFADRATPQREIHVAVNGNDTSGNGTLASPFATLRRAVQAATLGTAIRIHSGNYAEGPYLANIAGTHSAPIWIGGAPGETPPVLTSSGNGIFFSKVRFLIVHDLEIANTAAHGINIDDNAETANFNATRSLVLKNLNIHDTGGQCLKMAGVNDFRIYDSQFARCTDLNIDAVGSHDGVIANSLIGPGDYGVQFKGGSSNVEIRWNRFQDLTVRAVNMGGGTGPQYFRPPLSTSAANYEGKDIRLIGNVFENSISPAAFTGCVKCVAANNTIIDPPAQIFRILQETVSDATYTFAPSSYGLIYNNVVYFNRSQINEFVNVGTNTAPETFEFRNNLWYAHDNPAQSTPVLPVPESNGIYGLDPMFINPGGGTYDILSTSPAAAKGYPLGIALERYSTGDFDHACWFAPPSIGAYER